MRKGHSINLVGFRCLLRSNRERTTVIITNITTANTKVVSGIEPVFSGELPLLEVGDVGVEVTGNVGFGEADADASGTIFSPIVYFSFALLGGWRF